MVDRMVTAIYVEDLNRSKKFYTDLLGLEPVFEAGWIAQLPSPGNRNITLNLQPKNDALIPVGFQKSPQGVSITFVVENCDEVYRCAQSQGFAIVQEPKNEEYGQRRFLLKDPDGVLVDVSSACDPSPAFIARYFGTAND